VTVDLAKIEQLIDLVSRSSIAELDLTQDGTRVRILKRPASGAPPPVSPRPADGGSEQALTVRRQPSPPPDVTATADVVVPAPMHGVFYRATAPGEPPFVEIGASIKAGQKICIIEAMKTFIDVVAETAGTVLAILAENGDEIEAGQALFHIRPASPP
jgi:acetyl-CoA carboxylase biotin carboxyl carrier protein